ncbi:hypothetical protein HHK36_020263 [Tetracentron sinense]|uniref:Jacalin-type lectin domain-containing protein n=1 Tax=Tetracentron sinense TaxID=13715 RepID=A0A834YWV5_TETSI|nr:hypothetical protein HHK36_020263 [Tetracentron sinense]
MIKLEAAGYPSWGGAWGDEGKCEIIQIFISHDKSEIKYIQFVYVENEKVVLPKRFGLVTGSSVDTVDLNHPSEFITWVSGSFSDSTSALTSITLGTNQGTYGPFGVKQNNEFHFRMGNRRTFAGFHGTHSASTGILSIGVYVKLPIIVNRGL